MGQRRLRVAMDPLGKRHVEERAAECGLPVSTYVRAVVRGEAAGVDFPVSDGPERVSVVIEEHDRKILLDHTLVPGDEPFAEVIRRLLSGNRARRMKPMFRPSEYRGGATSRSYWGQETVMAPVGARCDVTWPDGRVYSYPEHGLAEMLVAYSTAHIPGDRGFGGEVCEARWSDGTLARLPYEWMDQYERWTERTRAEHEDDLMRAQREPDADAHEEEDIRDWFIRNYCRSPEVRVARR